MALSASWDRINRSSVLTDERSPHIPIDKISSGMSSSLENSSEVSLSSIEQEKPVSQDTAEAVSQTQQHALLLHGPRQQYQLTDRHPVPTVKTEHDMLVKVKLIGLNPIDWKAP